MNLRAATQAAFPESGCKVWFIIWQKRFSADSSILKKTLLPRVRDFNNPALRNSLMWREHAGWDSGNAATISMQGISPLPANCRKIQIRAGWLKARANAARSTEILSNASSFATGMDFIFQICNIIASGILWCVGDGRRAREKRGSRSEAPGFLLVGIPSLHVPCLKGISRAV
jgi:hypothetical protein